MLESEVAEDDTKSQCHANSNDKLNSQFEDFNLSLEPGTADDNDLNLQDPTIASTTTYFSSYSFLNDPEKAHNPKYNPVPIGCLFSPCVTLSPEPPRFPFSQPPERCQKCNSYMNLYNSTTLDSDSIFWNCVFCDHKNKQNLLNCSENDFSEANIQVLEYVTGEPETPIMSAERTCIFLVDGNFASSSFQDLRVSLDRVLKSFDVPENLKIGLIVFSSSVAVYDIKNSNSAEAHIVSGEYLPSSSDLQYLGLSECDIWHNQNKKSTIDLKHNIIGSKSSCTDNLLQILNILEASSISRPPRRRKKPSEEGPRCLGVAVSVALSMIKGSDCRHSNIIICSAGSPNFGPGKVNTESENTDMNKEAKTYYTSLAEFAQNNSVSIDMFCEGYGRFGNSSLRSLVTITGGSILLYNQYGEEFVKDLNQTLFGVLGFHGELETFASPSISFDRILGSISTLPKSRLSTDQSKKENLQTEPNDVVHHRFILNSLQPRETIAFYIHIDDALPGDYVYFQFVVYYNNRYEQRITRICTYRVRLTGNILTYMRSVDCQVVATLIGKSAILLAENLSASDEHWDDEISQVQSFIDSCVKDIYFGFGEHVKLPSGARGKSIEDHLADLPLMLYLLRQGPMLGPLLQNYDDISNLRTLFLHSNLQDSIRIIMPQMISFNSLGEVEQLPLANLSLQSDRILSLDHHTHLFIWSGKDVNYPEFDSYRDACLQRCLLSAYKRYPQPRVLVLQENSSDERWLRCRLIPCHNDTISQQNEDFPQLNKLQPHIRSKLLDKFLQTDELSFRQYLCSIFK